MPSPKTYAILLLAATTVGGAVIAWRQYGELVELRAATLGRDERADLQKRVWQLEKLNRELQDKLAAQRDPAAEMDKLLAGAEGERAPGRGRGDGPPRGGRGDPRDAMAGAMQQANAIRELMNKPEVQAMLSVQQKAAIEQRYAALFKNLNLPPEQLEKLKTLLADRATTVQDVMAAAAEQGVNPRDNPEAFRKMIANAQNEINQGIKAAIGENGFAQLTNYEQTLPQRNLVNDLQQRLSYTNAALSPTQAEQLVQILASTTTMASPRPAPTDGGAPGPGRGPPPGGGPGRGPDLGGMIAGVLGGGPGMFMGGPDGGRGGTVTLTPAAVTQAQAVLTPPQLSALQQIQQQQQAQQQLRQIVNDTLTANQPQPPGNSTPPPRKRPGGE